MVFDRWRADGFLLQQLPYNSIATDNKTVLEISGYVVHACVSYAEVHRPACAGPFHCRVLTNLRKTRFGWLGILRC